MWSILFVTFSLCASGRDMRLLLYRQQQQLALLEHLSYIRTLADSAEGVLKENPSNQCAVSLKNEMNRLQDLSDSALASEEALHEALFPKNDKAVMDEMAGTIEGFIEEAKGAENGFLMQKINEYVASKGVSNFFEEASDEDLIEANPNISDDAMRYIRLSLYVVTSCMNKFRYQMSFKR